MKIILTADVAKLGKKHDVKDVSSGHALNLLIPKGLAVAATREAMKKAEAARAKSEGERKIQEELLVKNIEGLEGVTLNIVGKANDKGHLFAGLHREAIADELLKQTQLRVDPSFIQLEHPIKEVGEYDIEVTGGGKSGKLKVIIQKQ